MADTYAQAISMMADWIPFLAEAEAGLQGKMDKQGGEIPPAPAAALPPVPDTPVATPSLLPAAALATLAGQDETAWDDDTFDDWAEDMTADDQPVSEEGNDLLTEDSDPFDDEPTGDAEQAGDDLQAELDLSDTALPPASKKAAPIADEEDDWLAAIKQ